MIFGEKEKVAIEYQLIPSPYQEEKLLNKSWGIFSLWIKGQDICEYVTKDCKKKYEWNLIYIVEWLCNNLEFIFGYDPYPLPVQGKNVLELIQESNKFECDEDDEFYLWYQAKSSWTFRHSWFSNRAGSILADVFFRRIDNNIEITWDNNFFEDNQIYFVNPMGTYVISKEEFKNIVFKFLNDILINMETVLGKDAKIEDQTLDDLWKKINLLN
jgi:hypothetical protein